MKPTKVYLVEDHPALRQVMTLYLSSWENLQICGSSRDAETALAELADGRPRPLRHRSEPTGNEWCRAD